ncbi:MAG: helix-turn-helix transcriptional regulator [Chloroflexi bacterium]|nr:helix-turn-helix transcriptional regulator [Chloroflexota bacterium]
MTETLASRSSSTTASTSGGEVAVLDVLPSKINMPAVRQHLVARPGLLERLDTALSSRVSLVAAPAGFGKTTLLVDWAARFDGRERVAWLSLEEADNDPTRFWTGLVSALQARQIDVSLAAASLRDEHSQESVVQQLLGEIVSLREQVVLVLDDYHVIQTPTIHAGMRYLIEHLPAQLHVVISSRSDPPLPLARLRASGQLTELRAVDLRFSLAECEVFLQRVMGLALSGEQVEALDARTEGWPAGLQLAALSLRERPDASAAIAGFTGTHRFIIDYLVEEVLSRLPAAVQIFLAQTSILRQLSGPLCDAVTEGVDGAHLLEELERASLFVTAIDDERRWYRYHQLFADTLRHRLERQDAASVPALHRRACLWYARQGVTEEAVEHALAGADWETAAELMDPLFRLLLHRGEQATLRRWLEMVPVEVRQTQPALSGRYALALLHGGELSQLDQYLPAAEAAAERSDTFQTTLGILFGVHAQLACLRDDQQLATDRAERALSLLVPGDRNRSMALLALGIVATRRGELATAERALGEVVDITRATFAPMATFQVHTLVGDMEVAGGRLRRAAASYTRALDEVGERSLAMREQALLGLAGILREWNRLDAAEAHLDRVMESRRKRGRRPESPPVRISLERARILIARGHLGPAGEALHLAVEVAEQVGSRRLRRIAEAFQVRLALRTGELSEAGRWADELLAEGSDLSNFEREPEALTLARVRLAQATPDVALALLDGLLPGAEQHRRAGSVLEILCLRALGLNQLGEERGAVASIERALELGEPEGHIRVFADERDPMATVLRQALSRGIRRRYVGVLLSACAPGGGAPGAGAAVLTAREREVLHLLGLGLSNKEIAERLVLSEGTAKSHVHNLISKLGVESRTQVIARAREMGVLAG